MLSKRTIVHVDMDAFFASVEQRDRPELRGQPVLVGRLHRGVVATCSYEARQFGIRSAMPMSQALRQCPHAVVVSPRFDAYQRASAEVFAIFQRVTPLCEALSLDEAFLEVTGSLASVGPGETIARSILGAIARELSLPASAGVGPNKFIAKLACDRGKPKGLTVVDARDAARWLAPLPVEQLLHVGPKTAHRLRQEGLATFQDVRTAPESIVSAAVGKAAKDLRALAWGIDEREVVPERDAKQMGSEATLDEDIHEPEALRGWLWRHVLVVASRLSHSQQRATDVQLKLKSPEFRLTTRHLHKPEGIALPDELFEAAWFLLNKSPLPPRGVRLIGVSASGFLRGRASRPLFGAEQHTQRERVEAARLAIEQRFGKGRLTRATALMPNRTPPRPKR